MATYTQHRAIKEQGHLRREAELKRFEEGQAIAEAKADTYAKKIVSDGELVCDYSGAARSIKFEVDLLELGLPLEIDGCRVVLADEIACECCGRTGSFSDRDGWELEAGDWFCPECD